MTIKSALISVSDKTGVVEFAKGLVGLGIEILSTGGTAAILSKEGVSVRTVDSYTGFPEMMDGRVKTLHPMVHGGILAIRSNPTHLEAMKKNSIQSIDLVVVNLYPFKQTIAKPGVTFAEAIENIDIGGPAMIRSSAKNHDFVTVVVDPSDYKQVLDSLASTGAVPQERRRLFALKAFRHTADYDTAIATYLSSTFSV
jgi:phosphoribosylaminoimidazolecarboxamide formyltransferase/IMP cyclohydrolase